MAFKDSTKTKSKNNKPKGNLFMCFRPAVVLDSDGSGGVDRSVLTYIAMPKTNKKEAVAFPEVLPDDDSNLSLEEEEEGEPGKKGGSRRFNLFEASMAKKMKINKGKSDRKKSSNILIRKDDFDSNFGPRRNIISRSASDLAASSSALNAVSNSSKLLICPTCSSSLIIKTTPSSSINSKSRSNQVHRYDHLLFPRGSYNSSCGLFLLLVSLFVLVFWGKFYAIFCTSTCLYLMPHWIDWDNYVIDSQPKPPENDSPACKKKIAKEGLIVRDRGSFRCQ